MTEISNKQQNSGTSKKRRHILAALLLAVAIFLAYMNSINGTWAMDDIVVKKSVGIENLDDMVGYRKVTYFTFMLNSLVAPVSPANFRIFNILIHIINSILVYMLALRTVKSIHTNSEQSGEGKLNVSGFSPEVRDLSFYAALLSGIIFALHPININAVAYIVQRMASLSALLVLISLHCYISAARSKGGFRAATLYVLSSMLIVAGIFAKENAVMAIPLILIYDYFFLSAGNRGLFFKRIFIVIGIGVICIGLASYLLRFHHTAIYLANLLQNLNEPMIRKDWMAADVYWTPIQHILTEFRVVARYILLILLPLPRLLVFDWWGFPVSSGIIEPSTTLLSISLLLSLIVFSLYSIKRLPFLSFGILWYLTAISLESFAALGSDLYFEHRNYLPMSGLTVGIAGQTVVSLKNRMNYRAILVTASILCLTLGSLTFARNFVWKDSLTLWGDTLGKSSSNLRALMAMGNSYLSLSDMDNAEVYYSRVVKIGSKDKRLFFLNDSIYSLGMIYLFTGRLDEANALITKFDEAIVSYKPKILKGFHKALNQDPDGALRDYMNVINITKGIDTVIVLTLMGDAYREKGETYSAMRHYKEAISIYPDFSAAYYGMGALYLNTGDFDKADEYLGKTLSIDPDHVLALSDTAEVMIMKRASPEDALVYAKRAVLKKPPFFQPYLTMGNILILLEREGEAENYYKKAGEHGAEKHLVLLSKARAYYMNGDTAKAQFYFSELQNYEDLPENIRKMLQSNP